MTETAENRFRELIRVEAGAATASPGLTEAHARKLLARTEAVPPE